jgi:hypothetical protein
LLNKRQGHGHLARRPGCTPPGWQNLAWRRWVSA